MLNLDAEVQAALAKACLVYPQEDGQFDTVRGSFAAGGVTVATASSHHVLCVSASVSANNPATPVEEAEAAAKALFDLPKSAQAFKELGTDGDTHYGIRDFSASKPLDPDWPHWADALAWWCDGRQVTFLTAKAPGGPTQETLMPSADQNRYWFTPPPKGKSRNCGDAQGSGGSDVRGAGTPGAGD